MNESSQGEEVFEMPAQSPEEICGFQTVDG